MDEERAARGPNTIRRLAQSYYPAALLHAAVELRIPDVVRDQVVTAAEIADEVGADAGALRRLMRGLALIGVLEQLDGDRFTGTALSERLRTDAPRSEAGPVRILAGDYYRAWAGLAESVRTGEPAYERIHGSTFYEHLDRTPAAARDFAAVMRSEAPTGRAALATHYEFGSSSIVDVGGGTGQALVEILRHHPGATGTVVDLEEVATMARARIESEGLSSRCEARAGDFFTAVPAGADVYLLRAILHDWNDARASRILAVCRAAMRPDSRLLIVNRLMPDEMDSSAATGTLVLADLQSLVVKGGQERTVDEYRSLLATAGLELSRVIPMPTGRSILEALPRA